MGRIIGTIARKDCQLSSLSCRCTILRGTADSVSGRSTCHVLHYIVCGLLYIS